VCTPARTAASGAIRRPTQPAAWSSPLSSPAQGQIAGTARQRPTTLASGPRLAVRWWYGCGYLPQTRQTPGRGTRAEGVSPSPGDAQGLSARGFGERGRGSSPSVRNHGPTADSRGIAARATRRISDVQRGLEAERKPMPRAANPHHARPPPDVHLLRRIIRGGSYRLLRAAGTTWEMSALSPSGFHIAGGAPVSAVDRAPSTVAGAGPSNLPLVL